MAVKIDEHFEKERILIKRYKIILLILVMVPYAVYMTFAIVTVTTKEINKIFAKVTFWTIAC